METRQLPVECPFPQSVVMGSARREIALPSPRSCGDLESARRRCSVVLYGFIVADSEKCFELVKISSSSFSVHAVWSLR